MIYIAESGQMPPLDKGWGGDPQPSTVRALHRGAESSHLTGADSPKAKGPPPPTEGRAGPEGWEAIAVIASFPLSPGLPCTWSTLSGPALQLGRQKLHLSLISYVASPGHLSLISSITAHNTFPAYLLGCWKDPIEL